MREQASLCAPWLIDRNFFVFSVQMITLSQKLVWLHFKLSVIRRGSTQRIFTNLSLTLREWPDISSTAKNKLLREHSRKHMSFFQNDKQLKQKSDRMAESQRLLKINWKPYFLKTSACGSIGSVKVKVIMYHSEVKIQSSYFF